MDMTHCMPCRPNHPQPCGYKGQSAPAFVAPVHAHLLSCIRDNILAIAAAMKFALLSIALAAFLGAASAQDGLSACAINCLLTGIPTSGCSLYVLALGSCRPPHASC